MTTYLGLQPVIVTRDPTKGQFNVLLNCCRHQRAVVLEERGNTRVFRCGYHGWSYDNRGDLISVPDRRGNDELLLPPREGLTRVPRVASYCGFLFASLSAEGESLTEQLEASSADLDRLAEEGIRFTDAHAPDAVCTPSRYGLLTGRYCFRSRLKAGVFHPLDMTRGHVQQRCELHELQMPGEDAAVDQGDPAEQCRVTCAPGEGETDRPAESRMALIGDADQEQLTRRQASLQRAAEAQVAMRNTEAAGGTAVSEPGARRLLGERPAQADPVYQRWWDVMSVP